MLARFVATIIAVWDPLPNPANALRFVSPESVKGRKAVSGRLLGRPARPSVHHSAEPEDRSLQTARTLPSTPNSVGALYLQTPADRFVCFWTGHVLDRAAN